MGPEQLRAPGPPRYATRGISNRRYRRRTRRKGETSFLRLHMPDSQLNGAERDLQHSFRFARVFNGLIMIIAVWAAYLPIRSLPDLRAKPDASVILSVRPVHLPQQQSPFRLAGAWKLDASDARFGGLSGLAIDQGRFLSVSDRGSVVRFDRPDGDSPTVQLLDLGEGPGPFGERWARDAESLVRDPQGLGWWVGFEQNHSLWLYDPEFKRALSKIDLNRPDWWSNRGAEGLIASAGGLLVVAENGRDAMPVSGRRPSRTSLEAGADVADAATAPDGSQWLLLRTKDWRGITQSIAPLLRTSAGYRAGSAWVVAKGASDNFEGMAIEAMPGHGLRFWLISDDGHRILARTVLVALDYSPHWGGKGPATGAGLSSEP
jgi:hypothetical protein